MTKNLFFLELKLLARERSAWLLCLFFAGALSYGLWNGALVAERTSQVGAELQKNADARWTQLREALSQRPIPPRNVAQQGSVAVLPPAPLALLATGQSDLSPGHQSLVLWRLNSPTDTRSELDNPSHLLAGRFDLAFVLVWLYPLFLLALIYDLIAGDRESGTLRLALSQGIKPCRWMARRALARALPILLLSLLATLAAGLLDDVGEMNLRLILALAVVLVYGLFWMALAALVNAVAQSAAGSATALGAAWVALVLVAPTLLNVAVETLYPTPSRPELVAAGREASGDAEKRGNELIDTFYRDHPELAPPGKRADFLARHLTVQSEVGHAVEPVRQKFDEQLARQQATVGRWRFISPAISTYETLTDLAGTGYWRYRAFREQVESFKHEISDFFTPKIHRQESVTSADADNLPHFLFREDPDEVWLRRVVTSLAGILAFAAVLGAWAMWNLRPARLGRITN